MCPDEPLTDEHEKKARLARIFGDTSPEAMADGSQPTSNDRDLRENVPPHHG